MGSLPLRQGSTLVSRLQGDRPLIPPFSLPGVFHEGGENPCKAGNFPAPGWVSEEMRTTDRLRPAPLLAAISLLLAPGALAQKVGDAVSLAALQEAEWIQGKAPETWEDGKLYLIECWATWCGPCVASIPHVEELHEKFADQGLRVIAMNVWEDGREKVAKFVEDKGDGMSYDVAYTGRGGAFEKEWLLPGGVKGIPHAFLVQGGKVIVTGHPAGFSNEVIGAILKGGDDAQKAIDELNAAGKKQQAIAEAREAWTKAREARDPVAMGAAADMLEAASPGDLYVPLFRNETLIAAKDWDGVEKRIEELAPEDRMRPLVLSSLARSIEDEKDVPASTLSKLIAVWEADGGELNQSPTGVMTLSRLLWKAGDQARAGEEAARSASLASAPETAKSYLPAGPFEKFAKAVQDGTMPTTTEFAGWMQASLKAAREQAEAEKKD